jgi:hypothetical protein
MKTKLILALCLPLLAFAGQNRQGAPASAGGPGAAANPDCPRTAECPLDAVTPATPTTLSAGDLAFAIEEERMAHDLYAAAAAQWNLRVFANIAAAETRHEAALATLAATQGFALPLAQSGVYASADLQRLHDQVIALVNESATGALRAGALVEETDIADLRRLASLAADDASRAVLANLERASLHHLSTFVRTLAARGVTYQPQVLMAEDFSTLAQSPSRPGASAAGGGRGFRGGR